MYTIQTLNKIAAAGTKRFDTAAYYRNGYR